MNENDRTEDSDVTASAECRAVNGFVCVNHRGVGRAYNRLFAGPATDIFDVPISPTGAVDCSKPATIALQRPDFTVEEIVEPIAPCPGG